MTRFHRLFALLAALLGFEKRQPTARIHIRTAGFTITTLSFTMTKLKVGYLLPLAVAFLDAAGLAVAPEALDGAPTWTVDNEVDGALTVSEDGFSAELEALTPGTVTVTVSADAALGDDVVTITQTLTVEIVDVAEHAVITAGEPRRKAQPAAEAAA